MNKPISHRYVKVFSDGSTTFYNKEYKTSKYLVKKDRNSISFNTKIKEVKEKLSSNKYKNTYLAKNPKTLNGTKQKT